MKQTSPTQYTGISRIDSTARTQQAEHGRREIDHRRPPASSPGLASSQAIPEPLPLGATSPLTNDELADLAQVALQVLKPAGPSWPHPSHAELREPSAAGIRLRAESDRKRHDKWAKLFDYPYPNKVRGLVQGRQLDALLNEAEHTGMQLTSSMLLLKAARQRSADPLAAAPDPSLGSLVKNVQSRATELKTMAALLTMSTWDIGPKFACLTRIRDVLKRANMSLGSFDFFGDSYLHLACRSTTTGRELRHLLRFFLAEGADANRQDHARDTPAHLLIRHADPLPALDVLLANGAQPNARDASDFTVMHRLAGMNNSQGALVLCASAGGDLQAVTERGETLLHMTLANHDDPITTGYLLRHGVSPLAQDYMGLDAVYYAETLDRVWSRKLLPHSISTGT